MKVDVRFHGLESSPALREHALRRVQLQLSRFVHEVSAVFVRIGDINGPKGGVDKRCQVTVRGPRFGSKTLEELSGDATSAVDAAVEQVARSLGKELERARSLLRRSTARRLA